MVQLTLFTLFHFFVRPSKRLFKQSLFFLNTGDLYKTRRCRLCISSHRRQSLDTHHSNIAPAGNVVPHATLWLPALLESVVPAENAFPTASNGVVPADYGFRPASQGVGPVDDYFPPTVAGGVGVLPLVPIASAPLSGYAYPPGVEQGVSKIRPRTAG